MPVATGARCATHPEVAAVEICQRCGAFVCGSCLELKGTEVLCTTCFARQAGKPSRRAVAALVLGILGLNCGFVWGVVGLVLAYRELRAIARGEAPQAGQNLAKGGQILGWINVAILVLALIAGVVAAVPMVQRLARD
jgi:hypothetical protein